MYIRLIQLFDRRFVAEQCCLVKCLFSVYCPQAKAQKGKLVSPPTTSATTAATVNVSVTTATATAATPSTVTATPAAPTEATVHTRFSAHLHGIYDDDDDEDMAELQPTFTGPIIKYGQALHITDLSPFTHAVQSMVFDMVFQ